MYRQICDTVLWPSSVMIVRIKVLIATRANSVPTIIIFDACEICVAQI